MPSNKEFTRPPTAEPTLATVLVQFAIFGVYAVAYLYVDLDNVARLVDRVVQTLDRNPQILTHLLAAVDTTVNAVTGRTSQSRQ